MTATHPSTGPKTDSGKFQSSKNSLKHGLTSESIDRFPSEIREAYSEFLATQYAEFNPETLTESDYLEQYAFNRFLLNRAQPMLAAAMDALAADPDNEILEKRYTRLTRHVRALERSAKSALQELRTFIADRLLAAELTAQLNEQFAGKIPTAHLTIPVAFPCHRLLDPKDIKRALPDLTLRFVQQRFAQQRNPDAQSIPAS
jgi:hypothetical protein